MTKGWQVWCRSYLGVGLGLFPQPSALPMPDGQLDSAAVAVVAIADHRSPSPQPGASLAQVNPNRDRVPAEPLPTPLPGDDPPLSVPPVRAPAAADDTVFAVTDIRVVGSTVFDDATLEAIVAPYENRSLTLGICKRRPMPSPSFTLIRAISPPRQWWSARPWWVAWSPWW
jgi:hypothetical protein